MGVIDLGPNTWDDGYPSGGNYWSDYNGTNLYSGPSQDIPGSDGIGDTPYIIDADSQDNYPLMWPWNQNPPLTAFAAPQYQEVNPGVNANFDASPSTGNITNYTWDFGDRSNGNGITASHSYSYSGYFLVTLTVADGAGGFAADTCIVKVLGPQDPYPIYGYIRDASDMGALAGCTVEVTYFDGLLGNWNTLTTVSSGTGQYMVDLNNYFYDGDVFCNVTANPVNGNPGYNYTTVDVIGSPGGRYVNILCEDVCDLSISSDDISFSDPNPAQWDEVTINAEVWWDIPPEVPAVNIVKAVDKAQANPGETLMYMIYINNTGTGDAFSVWVNETYPADVTFLNSNPMPTFGNNVWFFGNIAPGADFWIFVNVTINTGVETGTIITNNVMLEYWDSQGTKMPAEYRSADTQVVAPDTDLEKWGPIFARADEIITYWINYSNSGTDWSYNNVITEIYPADVTFISAIPAPSFGDNVWIISALAPGSTGTIQVTMLIGPFATGTLTNQVIIDSEDSVGNPSQRHAWWNTTVIPGPYLSLVKTAPANATQGEDITYTITCTNVGSSTAYNVWINETYPYGVTYISAVPVPTTPDDAWCIGILPPGSPIVITITVQVGMNMTGVLENWVQAEYQDELGIQMPTEYASAITTVLTGGLDHILVTPNPSDVIVGGTRWFTASAYDAFNNYIPGVTFAWGTNMGSINSSGFFTAQTTPGSGTVTATNSTIIGSANVTVFAVGLDHIVVTPDPVTVTVGETQAFTATQYDMYANVIPCSTFIWTTDVGVVNSSGFFTAQTVPGVGMVTATNGTISGSATVNVVASEIDHIVVLPNPVTIGVGLQFPFFIITAYDIYNNVIPGVGNCTVTTNILTDGNGTIIPPIPPDPWINVTVGNITVSVTINIIVGPIDHIVVTPDPAIVVVDTAQQFTAVAYDTYNNAIPGVLFAWTTNVGVVNSTGYFTAQGTPATGWVKATNGTVFDTATVNVTGSKSHSRANHPAENPSNITASCTVSFYLDSICPENLIYREYEVIVPYGGSANVSYTWLCNIAGDHTLIVAVTDSDPADVNPSNNQASKAISISEPCGKLKVKASSDKQKYISGEDDQAEIIVKVTYLGNLVTGANVTCLVYDPNGPFDFVSLSENYNGTYIGTYPFTNSSLSGTYRIKAIATKSGYLPGENDDSKDKFFLDSPVPEMSEVDSISVSANILAGGTDLTITANVSNSVGVETIFASLSGHGRWGSFVMPMFDDGTHSDTVAGDGTFTTVFDTLDMSKTYLLSISVNGLLFENLDAIVVSPTGYVAIDAFTGLETDDCFTEMISTKTNATIGLNTVTDITGINFIFVEHRNATGGKNLEFIPSGNAATAMTYAHIVVSYNESDIPANVSEDSLRLWVYNIYTERLEPCIPGGVDTLGDLIWGDTEHCSEFKIVSSPVGLSAYSIQLVPGWNLVSVPIELFDGSIERVLSPISGIWDSAKYYDCTDIQDPWKSYRPGSSINDLQEVDHTMALWLHVSSSTELPLFGVERTSTQITLHTGWNLVGYPTLNTGITVGDALWGTGADRVEVMDPGSPSLQVEVGPNYILSPGMGLWVHVPADSFWTVNG